MTNSKMLTSVPIVKLPIDVIPGSDPPRFAWRRIIDTAGSREVIEMDGMVPVSIEKSLADLVQLTKRLARENASLRGQLRAANDRLEAERCEPQATPPETPEQKPTKPPPAPVPLKKGGR